MTEDQEDTSMMKEEPLSKIERRLSEMAMEDQVQQAEITDVSVYRDDGEDYVALTVETVTGYSDTDYLPVPDGYRFEQSDLVTLLEFTGRSPNDLRSLVGDRIPFRGGEIPYWAMREVLRFEEKAVDEWDAGKRMEKVNQVVEE